MDPGRARVIAVLGRLARGDEGDPGEWKNRELATFLEACAGWLEDCDGYYAAQGEGSPEDPWVLMADALMAARVYE